jgi:predicted PurR-regulated permease PerM
MRDLEDHTLIVLLIAVSVAFGWILWPFYGAILWATVLAIVFAPLCSPPWGGIATLPPSPRS